mgnify:FL=1
MSKSRTQNAKLNIAFALVLQIVTFFRGLILPRIIIPAYGSDVNGLISSITQFLTYISLLEAGVGSIFRTSLYKPLANGDMEGVSGVINEQKRFYRKIGLIFVFYVIALCFVYPMIAKTETDKTFIVTCILILSISTFAEYFFSLPYVSLLSADQKVRISYIVSIVYTIVNILVSLFWVALKADIRLIYLSMSIIGLLRPLFYTLYVKMHYALNKKAVCNRDALNQRWNGIVHHFAFYVHTNTDSTILTLFISTAMVSVYNVYNAIICGIYGVVLSVSNSVAAGLGNLLVMGNKDQINRTVDSFELLQAGLTTMLYTIVALTLIPFVRIYTAQMTDMPYIQPLFGYIMVISGAIYCFRCIYSTISLNANKYKETQLGAVLECVVNLVLSLVLVLVANMGLVGIAIGTAMGMLVRYIFDVCFLSKNVLNRSVFRSFKMLFVSVLIAVLSIAICHVVLPYDAIDSMIRWLLIALATAGITALLAVIVYTIFYRNTVKVLVQKILRKEN